MKQIYFFNIIRLLMQYASIIENITFSVIIQICFYRQDDLKISMTDIIILCFVMT